MTPDQMNQSDPFPHQPVAWQVTRGSFHVSFHNGGCRFNGCVAGAMK
jgi:hypothetical protein